MPSSYTLNLGIELPANGEQDGIWGDIVNENMDILDRAINGQVSLTLTGTTSTLTTTDGALSNGQFKLLVLAGSPSGAHTITLSPNDAQKIYFVRNTTAQSVIFTQGSGGNITVATGDSAIIYANGGGTGASIQSLSDHFSLSSVKITGGTIDGTVIGGTTAAAGSFTIGTFGAGTAPLPSITFTGDTDTGIWSPGVNQVSISTTGVQRFAINGAGNASLLAVSTEDRSLEVGTGRSGDGNSFIDLIGDATYTDYGLRIIRGAGAIGSSQVIARGGGIVLSAQEAAPVTIQTTNIERMRVTATGDVGIGTSSPGGNLHIQGATANSVRLYLTDGDATGVTNSLLISKSNLISSVSDRQAGSSLWFGTADTERMRIDTAGSVGIGTTAPLAPLHVNTASGASAIRFSVLDVSYAQLTSSATSTSLSSITAAPLFFSTNNTERMRITPAGNVGIGTTIPGTDLEIASNTTATGVVTASITGTTMDVTVLASGVVAVGDRVSASAGGVDWNTYITAFGTGSGGVGTYTVNNSQTVASGTLYTAAAANSILRLTNVGTAERDGQTIGGLEFFGSDLTAPGAGVKGYVALVSESTSPDYAMIFGTSDNIASTFAVERMRITSLGRVGLGTKAPLGSLHIQTTLNNQIRLQGGSTGDIGAGFISWHANDGTRKGYVGQTSLSSDTFAVWNDAATAMVFATSALEAMRITAAGSVGIGIAAPAVKLDVEGDALIFRLRSTTSNNSYMRFDSTGTSFPFIGLLNGTGVFGNTDASPLRFNTDALERLRITATGDIGIGTTTPSAKLAVVGDIRVEAATTDPRSVRVGIGRTGDGAANLDLIGDATYTSYGTRLVRNSGATGTSALLHRGTGDLVIQTQEAAAISLQTTGVERLRITATGIVSLPALTSEAKILELGTGRAGDGDSVIDLIGDATYTDFGARFGRGPGANGTTVINHRGTGGLLLSAADAGIILFNTNNTERMRITPTGDLGIGTTAPGAKLHVLGNAQIAATATEDRYLKVGVGRSGDGNAFIDLVGDATYSAYGLRIQRSAGANGDTLIQHRGTGTFYLSTVDASVMVFQTASGDRLRLAGSGVIAIPGVTTETRTLEIGTGRTGDGASTLDLVGDATYTDWGARLIRNLGANGTTVLAARGTGGIALQTQDAGALSFITTNITRAVIPAVGGLNVFGDAAVTTSINVGISRSADGASDIRLVADTANQVSLNMVAYAGTNGIRELRSRGTGALQFVTQDAAPMIFTTAATERVRILSTGEVGVGTSLPLANLHVNAAATAVAIRLSVADVSYGNLFATATGVALNNITANALTFGTTNTERMRIDASGNVGIGNIAPITKLDVTGDVVARGVVYRQQLAEASFSVASTLTIANLLTGIILYTGALATLTLPTGTLIEGGVPATFPTNMSFDFSVINIGTGAATLGTAAGLSLAGSMAVAAGASGLFRARKTGLNTFTIYRIS